MATTSPVDLPSTSIGDTSTDRSARVPVTLVLRTRDLIVISAGALIILAALAALGAAAVNL